MKKVFITVLPVLLLLCAVHSFAQPSSRSVAVELIDDFDTEGDTKWTVTSSRYVAEGFPKFGYFPGIPNSLKPFQKEGVDPKVFGVRTAYNRKGDNWFEITRTKEDKVDEYNFVGVVDHLDFWVWGANYRYYLEVMVRDSNGCVHVLPACNLMFNGWKNVVVKIPGWLQQCSRLRSGPHYMTFVGFRIRSDSNEFVDDFTIYFDKVQYMTNSLSYIYDGYELNENDFAGAETGASASGGAASSGSSGSSTDNTAGTENGEAQ